MRRGTRQALIASALLAVLAACGSDPATATLVMPAKVETAAKTTVEGAYSESKAGLEVTLRALGDERPLATTTTDNDGRYKLTFVPDKAGRKKFVVTVVDADTTITSTARALRVLGKTGISVKVSGGQEAKVADKRALSGAVEPAVAGREVVLESSPDAKAWAATSDKVVTGANGKFHFRLDTAKPGDRYYRVVVSESDSNARATTDQVFLGVYDYSDAGRNYLRCVALVNEKSKEFNSLTGFEVRKSSAERMAARDTDQAECLRQYSWPPSVAEDIEAMAANSDLDADNWSQMSRADTEDELNDLWQFGFTADVGPPTRVRAGLGLPKRPV